MSMNAISTANMSRADWLMERTKGIGGSDSGIVLGLNKYKTPFELWLEKTGRVTPEEIDSEAIYWGNQMEDVVAREFMKRTGKKVHNDNHMHFHPDYPFIFANVDRLLYGESAVLECKTASAYLAKLWKDDEIPDTYLTQVQHYLGVTGLDHAYIAVLIGGNKFVYKEINRDDELIWMIFNAEVKFWNDYVIADVAPPLDGTSAAEKYLKEKYERAEAEKEVVLGSDSKALIEEYLQREEELKPLMERQKEIKNLLKAQMKDAEKGIVGDYITKWFNITQHRVDSKALKKKFPDVYQQVLNESTYRKFDIKERPVNGDSK
ncbi:YqaJ viral recombinase family protein [Sporolactobacillus terrae]|uniref:YqaJ viral recombinase family nuclease n=1 Tax=Sporolactobacillus terrae TaxID=269673 RepID=UPI000561F3CF|nr:YqaJ viral recombinase family protein [Sporolactobacillus terrae]